MLKVWQPNGGLIFWSAITDSANTYYSLDNFEYTGVIVWCMQEMMSGESDASAMAGLPELFPELGEAWILLAMVDYTGTRYYQMQVHQNFSLKGNKCGSTAEYCVLQMDGI